MEPTTLATITDRCAGAPGPRKIIAENKGGNPCKSVRSDLIRVLLLLGFGFYFRTYLTEHFLIYNPMGLHFFAICDKIII
ncbi:hypothetical protein Gura_1401 [Geotalea uraniireducens Rf4]|uniref:Uncharacterized protein n=1 Tax=Geotalea uraniireducens (strain Rf4) TaxID=351605 RepID=A5G9Z1_GEOUR|nr:hypothetical protein Gura_1401 [Geotalea uraniireducens Rf4]